MKYFFTMSLLVDFVLAFYFALQFCWSKEKKYVENYFCALCCMASAIWSLGFGVLILQTDADKAYLCRVVGMVGVFLYLITTQMLVCYISGIKKQWRYLLDGISFLGIIVYFFTIQKSEVVYRLDNMGMTYYFKAGFCNNMYIAYSVIIAFNILCVIIYMMKFSKVRRIQAFGKSFLLVELLVLFGMMLDTVFPLIGKAAIPGSSLTQFWGLAVLYHAVNVINRSRINITNMSEFIYYSLAMPVLVYDVNRKIQIMNDAASSFLKISADTMEAKNINLSQLFDIDEEETFVFAEKRKDVDAVCQKNQVYCSLAISKINDSYGDIIGYIIIVTDLSDRIKALKKLEEAKKEAELANQAKSTFLASMSHEIRTPMNAIIGFSELVLKMKLSPQVREHVEDIKAASKNLLAIINDILDISKIESGKLELVCQDYYVVKLFHDIFFIISNQVEKKGLDFHMTIDPDMPSKLFGDKIRIRGILTNLLNNAVKYTNQGEVSLEAKVLKKQDDMVTIEFKIADTGCGIKPEEQERIFESFSRVDQRLNYGVEGTGLGLSIVKGYVALMEGEIHVTSVYGEGSVFTVVLDQKIVDAKTITKSYVLEDEKVDDFSMGNMTISDTSVLVVDDNQINLKVASSSLAHYGLSADTASSGEQAIALCRKKHYQIIFMDQMMPEMDGIEAMKQIRKLDSYYDFGGSCKIIVLTANAISGVREELMQQGFDEYLGKPLNFKRLEQLFVQFLPEEKIQIDQNAASDLTEADTNQQEILELQKMLPQVEIAKGITFCGGRIKDYLSLLQTVYCDSEKMLKELECLKQQNNYDDYTIKIHAMKGIALNMGAEQVADMARQQEQAGRKGEYAYIDANLDKFEQEYRILMTRIESVLDKYQMLDNIVAAEEKENLEEADVIKILKDMKQSIESFDFANAADIVRDTKKHSLPEQYQEAFAQISQWIDEMEVEKIQEKLESLLGTVTM